MSRGGVWATLGIDQTADAREIRRAYARQLKLTNPEDDADGFQALRAAYDHAVAWAARAQMRAGADAENEGEEARLTLEPDQLFDVVATDTGVHVIPAKAPLTLAEPPGDETRPSPGAESAAVNREIETGHRAACQRLHQLVVEFPVAPHGASKAEEARQAEARETLEAALQTVLRSPAMEAITVHAGVEAWLAGLIAQNAPRADALIEPVVKFFGWDADRIGGRDGAVEAVLARRRDIDAFSILSYSSHPQHGAWQALARKPSGLQAWRNRLTPQLPDQVARVLTTIRQRRPSLLVDLDPDARAWWDRYLSQPRIGPISIWAVAAAPPFLGLAGAGFLALDKAPSAVLAGELWLGSFAAILALVVLRLFALQWPKSLWYRRWAWRAPVWARLGWAGAGPLLLVASALIPASVWATVPLALASVAVALWGFAVAEPDRRPGPGDAVPSSNTLFFYGFAIGLAFRMLLRPGAGYPWRVRTLFAFVYLGLFWWVLRYVLPGPTWLQMSVPLVAAAVAFALGAQTLVEAWWRELDDDGRFKGLSGLGAVVALSAGLVLLAAAHPALRPAAAALAVACVLAHKTPAFTLAGSWYKTRDLVMKFGALGIAVLGAAASSRSGDDDVGGAMFLAGGLWLLSGVVVTLVAGFVENRAAMRPARRARA